MNPPSSCPIFSSLRLPLPARPPARLQRLPLAWLRLFPRLRPPMARLRPPSGAASAVEGASAKAPPPVVPAKAQAFTATPPPKKPDLEREIQVRIPVLVNTRDVQPGDELIRRDMKVSSKRAYDPVNESSLLKKGARHG